MLKTIALVGALMSAAPAGTLTVDTYADAPGYDSPGGQQTGWLNRGANYVYCKKWGPEVRQGKEYNHWWLKTDLDRGHTWQNQWVSAFYLSRWGNDEARDRNGADLPLCDSPAPAPTPTPTKTGPTREELTDHYLFKLSLDDFVKQADRKPHDDVLDWSSDKCSGSPDNPDGFDFVPACRRHDFGRRNYRDQGRLSEHNRARIDQNFQDDMYSICRRYKGIQAYRGVECRRIADSYWAAVRHIR